MNKRALLVTAMALVAGAVVAAEAVTDGVTPGKWTMDLEAAKAHAAKTEQAILVNFSGSDWCGWCKLMEEKVFSKETWQTFAKDNVVMVLLDFPRDETLVPKKYKERNEKLRDEMGVQGFPTFYVMAADGKTVLGQLGASQNATPEGFIADVQGLLRYSPAGIRKYTAQLTAEQAKAYTTAIAAWQAKQAEMDQFLQSRPMPTAENIAKVTTLSQAVTAGERAVRDIEVDVAADKMAPDRAAAYRNAVKQLRAAEDELQAWLAGQPERTEDNMAKFQKMQAAIGALQAKLADFEK